MPDSDHDLLIRIDTKLDGLNEQFTNHLKHHFMYTLMALGTAISAVIAVIIALI